MHYIKDFEYFLKLEKKYSNNTINSYISDVKEFKFKNFSNKEIKNNYENIINSKLENTSKNRKISALKSYLFFLMNEDKIKTRDINFIENIRIKRKIKGFLSKNEINDLLNSSDFNNKDYMIVYFLLSFGLRVSELINLKLTDIMINDAILIINGKGSKQRSLPILDTNIIKNYIKKHQINNYLFPNKKNEMITRQKAYEIVKNYCNKIINKKVNPHMLRHSYATNLLNSGLKIEVLKKLLGHENISTTENYLHLNKNDLFKTINEHGIKFD